MREGMVADPFASDREIGSHLRCFVGGRSIGPLSYVMRRMERNAQFMTQPQTAPIPTSNNTSVAMVTVLKHVTSSTPLPYRRRCTKRSRLSKSMLGKRIGASDCC